jgi:hypothetical protein
MSSLASDNGSFGDTVANNVVLHDNLVHDVFLEGTIIEGLPYNLGTNVFDYIVAVKLKGTTNDANVLKVHVSRVLPKYSVSSDSLSVGKRVILRNLLNEGEYSPCIACNVHQIEYENGSTISGESCGEIKYVICSLNEIRPSDGTEYSQNFLMFKLPFNKIKLFQSNITGSQMVPWRLHQATYLLMHDPVITDDTRRDVVVQEMNSSRLFPCVNEKVAAILTSIEAACADLLVDLRRINDGETSSMDEDLARTYSFNSNNRELHAFVALQSADLTANATMLVSNTFIKQVTRRIREAFICITELLEALSSFSLVVQAISGDGIRDIQCNDLVGCVQHGFSAVCGTISETLVKVIYVLPTPYVVSCSDWTRTYSCIFDVRATLDSAVHILQNTLPDHALGLLHDTRDQYELALLSAQESMILSIGNFTSTYLMDDVIRQDWNSSTSFRHGNKVTHGVVATFMAYYQLHRSLMSNCMGNSSYYNEVVVPLTLQVLITIGTICIETYASVEVGSSVRAFQYATDCKCMLFNMRNILSSVLTHDLVDCVVPVDWVASQFVYSKEKWDYLVSLADGISAPSIAANTRATTTPSVEYMHELRTTLIDILIVVFIVGEESCELVAEALTTKGNELADDVPVLQLLQLISGGESSSTSCNADAYDIKTISVASTVLKFKPSPHLSMNNLIRNRYDMIGSRAEHDLAGRDRLQEILSSSYESL